MEYPVLTPEEAALPYAKYFNQPLAPIPQEKLEIWQGEAAPAESALPFADRAKFQKSDVPGLENGFTIAPDGTGFVANTTFMPGVTAEMFDWWFGWHSVGPDLRYKLWDHDDHYYARAHDPEYVLNPDVPVSQKTWGMNHQILENIGLGGPEDLLLCFRRPSEIGYDESLLGTDECQAMVCAYGLGGAPAVMTHLARKAEGGILFCSRFWMGYGPDENGNLVKLLPDGVSVPENFPRALYGHNIKEYSNLAAILPSIYAEEKDNW